jgi:hypothetical protein
VRFSEVAFFHAASRTLLVTDAVVYVSQDPPEIIPRKSLLELARDNWLSRWVREGGGATACSVASSPLWPAAGPARTSS